MADHTPLSATFDYLRAAQRLDMRASTYWRAHIAPYLADPQSSIHICRTLKQRVLWDIKDLIPRSVESSMFSALLVNPDTKAHTGRALRAEYGVSREYVAVRLLGYLERHLSAGAPTPFPLGTYLASLIPNRVSDETIGRLVSSGEFPHTLAGFRRAPEENVHQTASLKQAGRLQRAATAAKGAKRWQGTQAEHLAKLEAQRAEQFADHIILLDARKPLSLKEFAKHLRDTLPPGCSKKLPNPVAVMQYIHQRLRSGIPPHVYNELHAQATAYAVMLRPAHRDRLETLA
jgi:hypothetical protein